MDKKSQINQNLNLETRPMTKQSKLFTSLLSAASLSCMVALTPAVAQQVASLKSQLKREVMELQGTTKNVAETAGNVKKTAAEVEAAAAKTKATAGRVEGVALIASNKLGILGKKLSTCGRDDDDEETPEFIVQHAFETALNKQGVQVVDEDGPSVCNFRIYIGIDDDDDDNDGVSDEEDTDDYGDADDIAGTKNTDLPDEKIITIDVDEVAPALTKEFHDADKEKGLFIILESDNPDQMVVLHMDADSFEQGDEALVNTLCSVLNNPMQFGQLTKLFSPYAGLGKLMMSQPVPANKQALTKNLLSNLPR